MRRIIKSRSYKKLGAISILLVSIMIPLAPSSAQQLQHFGIFEYNSRSIALGLTGIIDAYGPLSVLRNPAVNRSGDNLAILPFFEWIGNDRWGDMLEIPQLFANTGNDTTLSALVGKPGTTSKYFGGVLQGRGVTLGYVHSNRDELLLEEVGLVNPFFRMYGRNLESDQLFGGYTLKLGRKARLGILFRNIRIIDTGVRDTLAFRLRNIQDIDDFLNETGAKKSSTAGVDFGGLLAFNILRRPVTVGFSLKNVTASDLDTVEVPMLVSAGAAIIPFRGLMIELNLIDILDEESVFNESGIRIGVEYIFRGISIRSGIVGDKVSFGVGLSGGQLNLDYGSIEVDHTRLSDPDQNRIIRETYQSLEISLRGSFY